MDLRWEWYPRSGINLSVAAFYKSLHNCHNPMETVVIPSAQLSVTYDNATGATNMGLEITGRTDLAFILSRVDLGGNVGTQTSSDRPHKGQSPYVITLRLGYENADTDTDTGTSALILYNVFGPRMAEVGAINAPDVLEQFFLHHQLDITFQQRLGRGFSLSLRARNLIDHDLRLTQAHLAIEAHRRGRRFALGLQKRW